MTIRMGRKAWRQIREERPESVTRREGEQVIVDLSLQDYEIRRDATQRKDGNGNR